MSENYEKMVMGEARKQAIVDGWQKYHFPGEPPRQGTPVEQRMIDTAREYIKQIFSKKLRNKNEASQNVQISSESEQRVLHNQLAIMIFGESRTNMDSNKASDIKDFAAEIAYPGFSLDQIYETFNE